MTEFVGRTGALRVYSYPDNSRAAALALFARNFATGPKVDTAVGAPTEIPWNAIDSTALAFTVTAGDVTVSIPGDVTGRFSNGDSVTILPTRPDVLPVLSRSVASVPAFAGGVTTFDLNSPIDGSTTGGAIENNSTPSADVPITPRSTGVVLVSGVATILNDTGGPIDAVVNVMVDGTALPVPSSITTTIPAGATAAIPFMAEAFLPVGTTTPIQVQVTGTGATIVADSSVVNVQEVSVATG